MAAVPAARAPAPFGALHRRGECEDYGGSYRSSATSTTPTFKLYCGKDYDSDNMAQTYTSTFGGCMDACAGYNTGNAATCLGVSYHAYSTSGLSNCFLKSSNNLERLVTPTDHIVWSAFVVQKNPPAPGTTVTSIRVSTSVKTARPTTSSSRAAPLTTSPTLAMTTAAGAVPEPTPTDNAQGQSSVATTQAWIAGPVIGAVAALLLVGFLIRYFLVRRNRRNAVHDQTIRGLFSREAAEAY